MNKKQIISLSIICLILIAGIIAKRIHTPAAYRAQETVSLEIRFDENRIDRMEISRLMPADTLGASPDGETEIEKTAEGEETPAEHDQSTPVRAEEKTPEAAEEDASQTVALEKTGGEWRVPALWNARGDAGKIKLLFEEITALRGEERGRSEALFDDFGISERDALHVVLYSEGKKVVHLLVGSKTPGWQNSFIRMADSGRVYLADTRLLSRLGIYGEVKDAELKPDFWADLRMLSIKPEDIRAVEIQEKGKEPFEVGTGLPFSADEAKIRDYVQRLSDARAAGVLDPNGAGYGFEEPELELTLIPVEGDPVILTVGAVKFDSTTERYVHVSSVSQVFYAAQYAIDRLKPDAASLIRDNPLEIEASALEKLVIQTPAGEFAFSPAADSWKSLDDYVRALGTFAVSGLEIDALPAPDEFVNRLEISHQGKEPVRISCAAPKDDKTKNRVCVNAENSIPFLITEAAFKTYFENLDRLKKPAQPEEPSAEVPAPETGS